MDGAHMTSARDLEQVHGRKYVLDFQARIIQAAAFRRAFNFRHQRAKLKKDGEGEGEAPDNDDQIHDVRLGTTVKVAFAAPQFTVLSIYMLLAIHATLLYEFLGAPLSFIAFFTAFARSIDVLSDPIMSWVTDSARTPYGRRMPFMVTGCLLYAVTIFCLLGVGVIIPPDSGESICNETNGTFFVDPPTEVNDIYSYWYGIFFILFYLTDTYCNVPYNALGPELTDDFAERNSVYIFQNVFGMVGTMVGAVAPPAIEAAGLSKPLSFAVVGAFFGGTYILSVINLVSNIAERGDSQNQLATPLVPSMIRAFRNPAFTVLLAAWFIDAIGWFSLSAMLPFYVKYFLEPETRTAGTDLEFLNDDITLGAALLILFISAIIGMPFWNFLANRMGKYEAWLAYNLFNGVSNALYGLVGTGDWELAFIVTALNGIPFGGKFLSDSTLADTIDYDEFLTGQRREAQFTMFSGFVPKIVSIPSQALPIAIIAAVGFQQSSFGCSAEGELGIQAQSQSELVKFTIQLFFILMPVAANILSFAIKTRYPIKKKTQLWRINAGIELHKNGFAARDPVTNAMIPSSSDLKPEEHLDAMLLDHFFLREQRALVRNGVNPSALIQKLAVSLFMAVLVFALSVCGVIFTFFLLENQTLSWIPSLFQIFVGFSLLYSIFTFLRLRAAFKLKRDPVDAEFIKKWVNLNSALDSLDSDVLDPLEEQPRAVAIRLFKNDELNAAMPRMVGSTRNLNLDGPETINDGVKNILGEFSTRFEEVANKETDEEQDERLHAFNKDI